MIPSAATPNMLRVEAAGADDLDEVMRIMDNAFDPRFGEAWTRAQCSGILPMAGVELGVARGADGAAAGFCLFRTTADEAELLLLAVDPDHRGRGIGALLLDWFIERSRVEGVLRVHLEVRENNPALALYTKAGFAQVGRRREYYRGQDRSLFDALTLARPI